MGIKQWWPMWKKGWFNLLLIVLYTALSFAFATWISPDFPYANLIYGGALAYGLGNVHFVLWFTFYTRVRAEAQHGMGYGAGDELFF